MYEQNEKTCWHLKVTGHNGHFSGLGDTSGRLQDLDASEKNESTRILWKSGHKMLKEITNLTWKTKWPCSRVTVLIGWTGCRGWMGNIQDDDRFLFQKHNRLTLISNQFYSTILFAPSHKRLAYRFKVLFGWTRCMGQTGTILDDSIYFVKSITRRSWPLLNTN